MKTPDTTRRVSILPIRRISFLFLLIVLLSACSGSGPQTTLEPEGPIANDINNLWLLVFWVATAVFVVVEVALVYAIWKFRERRNDDRRPRQSHGNTALEITWTIIPAVLLAVVTVPMISGLFDMRREPIGDVLHIKVTGHQWWWEFEYVDEVASDGRTIITANELHIPANRDVYLTMTSADVIHSFWVPKLNGKRDVVPGRITNLTLHADAPTPLDHPHLGQCAEFCGLAHADMRIRAFVHDAAGYNEWVAGQLEPNLATGPGWDTFRAFCTLCHQVTIDDGGAIVTFGPSIPDRGLTLTVDGVDFKSSRAPNLTHFGSRSTFAGATFANTVEHLSSFIDDPSSLKPMDPDRNELRTVDEIKDGQRDRILGMPDYGLDQAEIDAVVRLLRSWN